MLLLIELIVSQTHWIFWLKSCEDLQHIKILCLEKQIKGPVLALKELLGRWRILLRRNQKHSFPTDSNSPGCHSALIKLLCFKWSILKLEWHKSGRLLVSHYESCFQSNVHNISLFLESCSKELLIWGEMSAEMSSGSSLAASHSHRREKRDGRRTQHKSCEAVLVWKVENSC